MERGLIRALATNHHEEGQLAGFAHLNELVHTLEGSRIEHLLSILEETRMVGILHKVLKAGGS